MAAKNRLIGFYNPYHSYPNTVVPIVKGEDQSLHAVYLAGDSIRFIGTSSRSIFTKLGPLDISSLRDFDPYNEKLFAYSPSYAVSYKIKEEAQFFYRILEEERLGHPNPFDFFRMAAKTQQQDTIYRGIRSCLALLRSISEEFATEWYQSTRHQSHNDHLPSRHDSFLENCHHAEVGFSLDKKSLAWHLCSLVNTSIGLVTDSAVLLPRHLRWDPIVVEQLGHIAAFFPESEDHLRMFSDFDVSTRSFVGSSDLVVAVNPDFLLRHRGIDTSDCVSFLKEAVLTDDFSWSHSSLQDDSEVSLLTGMAIYSLSEEIGDLTDRPQAEILRTLEFDKLHRRFGADIEAESIAIRNGRWLTAATVVQRHIAHQFSLRLPESRRPTLISFTSEKEHLDNRFGINHVIATNAYKGVDKAVYTRLLDALGGNAGIRSLRLSGFSLERVASIRRSPEVEREYVRLASTIASSSKPVAVCLAIDTSASMRGEKFSSALVALKSLIATLHPPRNDQVSIVRFSSEAEVVADSVSVTDTSRISDLLSDLTVSGRTALNDAVIKSIELLEQESGRILSIVLLTDGQENSSMSTSDDLEEALAVARTKGISIYSLGYGENADMDLLIRLSEDTGGFAHIEDIDSIRSVMVAISRRL